MAVSNDELSIIEYIFKGLVSLCLIVGGWLWNGLVETVKKLREDLANHKIEVAKTYAEKESLERIHDRIDAVQKDTGDIKNLLITTLTNFTKGNQ